MKLPWLTQMAWRDSRGSRRWLVTFMGAMVVGVAAVVSIQGFGANMRSAMEDQARSLLGADLKLESSRPFSKEQMALADSLGGRQVRQISFASMAYFPEGDNSRLVSVRAVEEGYPLYGSILTQPPRAAESFVGADGALVDMSLMNRYDVAPGDSVRIGALSYAIAGGVERTTQESGFFSAINPRIYIPYARVDSSLLTRGSRAEYDLYIRFDAPRPVDAMVEQLEPRLEALSLNYDTPSEEQENWVRGLGTLSRFLSLVAFVALLLGGVGVASAMHVYVKRRIGTVAVLRCLGASSWQALGIYVIQAAAFGILCALGGIALGVGIQAALPALLADFLPVDVPFRLAMSPLLAGLLMGLGITLLFALMPLAAVRRIAPLQALRNVYEHASSRRDPLWWMLLLLLTASLTTAAVLQASEPLVGLSYAGGVAVVCALLAAISIGLRWAIRTFFPSRWSYTWRQGLANLYRPQNQTLLLSLTLGFSVFLLFTLYLTQHAVLDQFTFAEEPSQANTILFDIQPAQLEGVRTLMREEGFEVLETVPLVPMRIASVQGVPVDSIVADSTISDEWAYTRQYRSTYRSGLAASERLVAGEFIDSVAADVEVVPISAEQDIAQDLQIGLGDTLTFNVQGVEMTTVIRSIRTVNWQQLTTNFFFVFPKGVLEDAPRNYVVLTRTPSESAASQLQSALVRTYPGILLLDVSLVMDVLNRVLGQITFVIRFMALFSLIVGVLVLIGSVVVSRVQRVRESVLLKTLGASRRQIYAITMVEYLFVGLLAAGAGALLAVAATWGLTFFLLEGTFRPMPWHLLGGIAIVTLLTVGIGLLGSRDIYRRTPMEVLQQT